MSSRICNLRAPLRTLLAVLALAAVLLTGSREARAAALTLLQLDQLQQYVECREQCELGRVATKAACLLGCGVAPAAWNKDLDSVVGSRRDYQLALAEFADGGTLQRICYENNAVVPKGQCGASNCLAGHSAQECADADSDGFKAWQEALAGTSDTVAQRACTAGANCNGFAEECSFVPLLDRAYCTARTAPTAFSLQLVEENAREIIVNVRFDYSPIPPTLLDVYVTFNGAALVLTESRGLAAATSNGKSVEVRQVGDNLLRVIVVGANDSRVIDPGPIAELVFRRQADTASAIGFSTQVTQREKSLAPSPGAQLPALRADSAWGAPVNVKSATDVNEGKVLLHYDFESEQRPLALSNAKSAGAVCDLLRVASTQSSLNGNCPVEPVGSPSDPAYLAKKLTRDRWISQLSALQSGVAATSRLLTGVNGMASWFDGRNDHLELPLTFNTPKTGTVFKRTDQSFSVSFWMFQENSQGTGEQVLFSRNAQGTELTHFALLSRPTATSPNAYDLVWLSGALGDSAATRTVVASGLPERKWSHVGISVDATPNANDASTVNASVYVDGLLQKVNAVPAAALASCPQFADAADTRMTTHQEGDLGSIRGTGPETIYFGAAAGNGLNGIDAVDSNGLGRRNVLRLLDANVSQPDYNPYVDRLVYASNSSGSSEIWLAEGDGGHPRRITSGFGSTADGVFARRPRWAPDGSGIVFESNAYDIDHEDNLKTLGYQLYYISYDAQANRVAIPGPANSILSELSYNERATAGDIDQYRLTRTDEPYSYANAQWLAGKSGTAELALGELGFTAADVDGDNPRGRRVRVARSFRVANASKETLPFVAVESHVTNRALLAARRTQVLGQAAVELGLLAEQKLEVVTTSQFSATVAAAGTCSTGGNAYTASIKYTNSGPAATCADRNRNQACDLETEDLNKDGQCTVADCNAHEFEGLNVGYVSSIVQPDMTQAAAGTWITANSKQFHATQIFGTGAAVRLEVTSPINSLPIPNGTVVATLRFCGSAKPALTFKRNKISQFYYLLRNNLGSNVVTAPSFALDPRIQSISGAEFSPDGKRLVLAVTFDARPMLLRTKDLTGTIGADLLTSEPVRVDGLSWAGVERLYPCNWLGAVRNPTTKLYQAPFEGALDEVQLFDYARTAAAYESEAQRGHERLAHEGRDGVDAVPLVACVADADCQAHELCQAGSCAPLACVPSVAYPCTRGRCQKLPVEVSPTEVYACVAECTSDNGCQEQQCANGPCRFCDSNTCSECKEKVDNIGGLTLKYIQGCPDRNSFACDRGTCVSECYASENGESKYLCDPATEYCRAGKCRLFDWNWSDLSPLSLAGGGEMRSRDLFTTTAVSQLFPVEIKAYGAADHAHPPELLVEGKASGVAGGDWFDVGRIVVDNETKSEAQNRPYVVLSPYALTQLRLRTILPPYENLTNSAMGLLKDRGAPFCSAQPNNPCRFAAQGSRAMLGYEAWIPGHISKCASSPGSCDPTQLTYLRPGTPIAIVLEVSVKDKAQALSAWTNKICPYWNGTAAVAEPVTATGLPNLLIYGDASRELSNQKTARYPAAAATALQTLDVAGKGFGVLNCNYVDDTGSVAAIAGIEIAIGNVTYPGDGSTVQENKTVETSNGCRVDVGTPTQSFYEPCYEWGGAQVAMDPFGSEALPYRSITLDRFTSFGWGNPPPEGNPPPGDNTP